MSRPTLSKFCKIFSLADWRGETTLWAILLASSISLTFWLKPWRAVSDNPPPLSLLSGNPVHGASLFSTLGCNNCHNSNGHGPRIDSAAAKAGTNFSRSPARLVVDMWNHDPQMWGEMKDSQGRLARPSKSDMVDLLTYIYLIGYEDEPGDVDKGNTLFHEKHCADCHSFSGEPGKIGPDLSRFDEDNPIFWAQRMWNHRRAMLAVMKQKEISWPVFQDREMVDLLTYVRSASENRKVPEESEVFPADPRNGKTLFRERGCILCHSIDGDGGKVGPDLGSQHNRPPTITQFAGLMWNHSPAMLARMDEATFAKTLFAQREMADLISYLYVVLYMEPLGRVDLGREVFNEKHCSNCHGRHGEGGKAGPSLARKQEYMSPQMAYILGTHGPEMYRRMRDKNITWPVLNEQELINLVAYLNSL